MNEVEFRRLDQKVDQLTAQVEILVGAVDQMSEGLLALAVALEGEDSEPLLDLNGQEIGAPRDPSEPLSL